MPRTKRSTDDRRAVVIKTAQALAAQDIYPSVDQLAQVTGYSRRSVTALRKSLKNDPAWPRIKPRHDLPDCLQRGIAYTDEPTDAEKRRVERRVAAMRRISLRKPMPAYAACEPAAADDYTPRIRRLAMPPQVAARRHHLFEDAG